MKKLFCMLALGVFALAANAQYYNPNMYDPSIGYRMGQETMRRVQEQYDNNPVNAPVIIGTALQYIAGGAYTQNRDDEAFEKLTHCADNLNFANASYWVGVCCEAGIGTYESISEAKAYYQQAVRQGNHQAAAQRLRQINSGNYTPYDEDDVRRQLMSNMYGGGGGYTTPISTPASQPSNYQHGATCVDCHGNGVCSMCNGRKYTTDWQNNVYTCSWCKGTGRCPVCYGQGHVH